MPGTSTNMEFTMESWVKEIVALRPAGDPDVWLWGMTMSSYLSLDLIGGSATAVNLERLRTCLHDVKTIVSEQSSLL
jgi:hypothetical protein